MNYNKIFLVFLTFVFFDIYFKNINKCLSAVDFSKLVEISELMISTSQNNKKIIFAGNGGSSSIAGHLTVDCINASRMKAVNFNDPGIITCFSNDYGYENWLGRALTCYADPGDLVILISSSGQSENMIIGAKESRNIGANIITLTGFKSDNPLKKLGDINLWVDSKEYNLIEMTHHVWLLSIVDYIIEKQSNNKKDKGVKN